MDYLINPKNSLFFVGSLLLNGIQLQVPNENRILYTTFDSFTNSAYNHCSYHGSLK